MPKYQNPLNLGNLREEVFSLFQGLGLRPGDCVLIHSGFKQLGLGGSGPYRQEMAHCLWERMQEFLTREGTILVPTLSHEFVGENNPVFHADLTKSCTGYLTELFRTDYAIQRSLHPTHSVAGWGAHLDYYLGDHMKDQTPVGSHSPFTRLMEPAGSQSAYILFLGCSTNANTSVHGIEELLEPDYLFDGYYQAAVIGSDNRVIIQDYRAHGFRGVLQQYSRLEALLPSKYWTTRTFLSSYGKLIEATKLWHGTRKILEKDPRALVQSIS